MFVCIIGLTISNLICEYVKHLNSCQMEAETSIKSSRKFYTSTARSYTDLRRCPRILELIMVDYRVAIWRAAIQKRREHAPQANEHTLMLFVRYSKPFKWFLKSTVQLDQCEVGSILKDQQWGGHQSTKCTQTTQSSAQTQACIVVKMLHFI